MPIYINNKSILYILSMYQTLCIVEKFSVNILNFQHE